MKGYNQEYLSLKRTSSRIFPERKYFGVKRIFKTIFLRLLISVGYAVMIGYITHFYTDFILPINTLSYISIVMGMLIAFRTNTAYDRYYEGRKVWGSVEEISINVIRSIHCSIKASSSKEETNKIQAIKNVVVLPYAMMYYLMGKPEYVSSRMLLLLSPSMKSAIHANSIARGYGSTDTDLDSVVKDNQDSVLSNRTFNYGDLNMPLRITYELIEYLEQLESDVVKPQVYIQIYNSVNSLSNAFNSCLRIQTTPLPVSYSSHLYQTINLYLLFLPFSLVGFNLFIMGAVQLLVSFIFMGTLAIGEEIEDPFGDDDNDLPLIKFCNNLYEEMTFMLNHNK
ncbi:hypothetical protein BB558_000370 [Smittium angustum]|uniref:Uncharacterized protein n=1 Tax=Smittium angustum TaxID=133377 RepID=A0A2U1JEK4_SMIAN|nr:hypothetical protein BB558_000370 [Smittium angustum]